MEKGRPDGGGGPRLTDRERDFAERHHGLVIWFLRKNRLNYGEYYDVAVFGYLRAVMRYHREEDLRQYAFTTVAWNAMSSDCIDRIRSNDLRRAREAYSLNDTVRYDNGDERERLDTVPDGGDAFQELEERLEAQRLLDAVTRELSSRSPEADGRRREHLALAVLEYTRPEIMRMQHMDLLAGSGNSKFQRDRAAIMEAAKRAGLLPREGAKRTNLRLAGGGGYGTAS